MILRKGIVMQNEMYVYETQKQNKKLKTKKCRSYLTIKINKNLQQNIIRSFLKKN